MKLRSHHGDGATAAEIEAARRAIAAAGTAADCAELLHSGRNKVWRVGAMNVKAFGVPSLWRAIVYSCFRKPKGLRALRNAARMARAGVPTPRALLFVEERNRLGLLRRSWLVTEQSPLEGRLYRLGNSPMTDPADRALAAATARLAATMHRAGIMHRDFSPGNILYRHRPDTADVELTVVDINRMTFSRRPIPPRRGAASLCRLWGQPEMVRLMATEYAEARKADPGDCLDALAKARRRFWHRYARRHPLKFVYRDI